MWAILVVWLCATVGGYLATLVRSLAICLQWSFWPCDWSAMCTLQACNPKISVDEACTTLPDYGASTVCITPSSSAACHAAPSLTPSAMTGPVLPSPALHVLLSQLSP